MTDIKSDMNGASEIPDDIMAKLDGLTRLGSIEYGQLRKAMADELGIAVSFLDEEYRERQKGSKEVSRSIERASWTVEPWPSEVDGAKLLKQLVARLKRHVVMSEESALTASLWAIFSWSHDAAVHSPILLVSSPEAECGKSTLLGLLALMVPRGMVVVEITPAVLYRTIEKWHPTILFDEADKSFTNNPELRAVVNAGWTRGTGVPRCNPDTHEPEFFETFGPKAVGLKGLSVPDTTLSRSIIIEMQRKLPGDRADDFKYIDDAALAEMRRRLSRWANDNMEALRNATPMMPEGFANRLAANWRLLLAVAEKCGQGEAARAAALSLSRRDDEASLTVELLIDCHRVLTDRGDDRIRSEDLVAALVAMEDRPWIEMPRTQRPITQPQLSHLLKGFKLKPKVMRIGESTPRGYELAALDRALERYAPRHTPLNKRH